MGERVTLLRWAPASPEPAIDERPDLRLLTPDPRISVELIGPDEAYALGESPALWRRAPGRGDHWASVAASSIGEDEAIMPGAIAPAGDHDVLLLGMVATEGYGVYRVHVDGDGGPDAPAAAGPGAPAETGPDAR